VRERGRGASGLYKSGELKKGGTTVRSVKEKKKKSSESGEERLRKGSGSRQKQQRNSNMFQIRIGGEGKKQGGGK